jgi:nitroreductase
MSNTRVTQHPPTKPHGPHPEWKINKELFPTDGPVEDQLAFLVQYAILAPSAHNAQPWIFEVRGETINLFADRSRRLPVLDPRDRELTIACGSALYALRLAMRKFEMVDVVGLLPDKSNPDLLATVTVGDRHKPSDDDLVLFRQIPNRRSSRMPFDRTVISDGIVSKCARDAEAEGAMIYPVADRHTRHLIATLIAEGDREQMHNPAFREELARWLRPNVGLYQDGIPSYAEGHTSKVWDFLSKIEPLVVRRFDIGKGVAAHDQELAEGSPLITVLCTKGDTPLDWMRAGQAAMRVSLRAQAAEVCSSYLNQPIEVEHLRPRLQKVLSAAEIPQLVLRMGHGPDVEPTPRRPVCQVVRRIQENPERNLRTNPTQTTAPLRAAPIIEAPLGKQRKHS